MHLLHKFGHGMCDKMHDFTAKNNYQPLHIKDSMDDLDNVYKLIHGLTLENPINLNGNIKNCVHALVHKHHINNFIPNSKLRRFNATPTNHRAQFKNSIFNQH